VGRSVVFIDGGYIKFITQNHFNLAKIDFLKLSQEISNDHNLLHTYYYYCMPLQSRHPTPDETQLHTNAQRFIEALKRKPDFTVRLGKLVRRYCEKCRKEKFTQKGVDVHLSVDMVRKACLGHIDVAVIVGGDSDFVPAIEATKEAGVTTRLVYYPGTISNQIRQAVDETRIINQRLIDLSLRTP
jgi:uncharacterized LabA/DUF88 family protein